MKFSCLQDNLSKGLAIVSRAVATRAPLPITQNILLEVDDSKIKITATNLEIAISTWVPGKTESEGSLTVPARMFTDFINSLPSGDQVDISATEDNHGIEINCGKFKGRISGTAADEFPPIPVVDDDNTFTVLGLDLKKSLERVVVAAATEDSRPVLTGVKMDISDEEITLATADGFRLAVDKVKIKNNGNVLPSDVIIPARTMQELQRLIPEIESEIKFSITESSNQVLFSFDTIQIVSQLVQGQFPDYSKLIPDSHTTQTIINREEFLQAARAASIFARDGSGIIKLIFVPSGSGVVNIFSSAEEIGDLENQIQAKIEGEEARIAFNSKFLIDVLNVIKSSDIVFECSSPSSPGVFQEHSDNSDDNNSYTHVVMPMFVQW
ncbi:MAG: DNA polymerase III subunit beta [Dehalococcoidia bacterium]|jgi:DNA polymerase-3 subunit beta|nr:DNA polymerase III subunit beta [Dehalococcoidia bacterium]